MVVILAVCPYNVTTHTQMWVRRTLPDSSKSQSQSKFFQTCATTISISAVPCISFWMETVMTHNFLFIS